MPLKCARLKKRQFIARIKRLLHVSVCAATVLRIPRRKKQSVTHEHVSIENKNYVAATGSVCSNKGIILNDRGLCFFQSDAAPAEFTHLSCPVLDQITQHCCTMNQKQVSCVHLRWKSRSSLLFLAHTIQIETGLSDQTSDKK